MEPVTLFHAAVTTIAIMLGLNDLWALDNGLPLSAPFAIPGLLLLIPATYIVNRRRQNKSPSKIEIKRSKSRQPLFSVPLPTMLFAAAAICCIIDDSLSTAGDFERWGNFLPPFVSGTLFIVIPVLYVMNRRRQSRAQEVQDLRRVHVPVPVRREHRYESHLR